MSILGSLISWGGQFVWKKFKLEIKSTHALGILALFLILLLIMNRFLFDVKTELTSLLSIGLIGALIIVIIGYIIVKIYTVRSK
jgi:tryptophan-rich sensory protein